MKYRIVDGQIHVYLDDTREASHVLWPGDLIAIVEAFKDRDHDGAPGMLADLLTILLEEHPEIFTCHYNAEIIN